MANPDLQTPEQLWHAGYKAYQETAERLDNEELQAAIEEIGNDHDISACDHGSKWAFQHELNRRQATVNMSKPRPLFVQLRNPRSGLYVKIDRARGQLSHKRTPGPYRGVPVLRPDGASTSEVTK